MWRRSAATYISVGGRLDAIIEPVETLIHREIFLDAEFADAIGPDRIGGRGLRGRNRVW